MPVAQPVAPDKKNPVPFVGELCTPASLLMLVLLAELLAVTYTLQRSGLRAFDWLLLASVSMFLLWSALGAAALLCRLRFVLARFGTAASAGLSFAICLLWIALLSVAAQWLNSRSGGAAIDWWWVLDTVAVASLLMGIGLRYAYLSLQLRLRQQSALHAEVNALHSRIRPHFLFNTFNSISSLIAIDAERAEQAVEDLAELFRANLQSGLSLVSWAQERELCQRYLRIEQSRLGERLRLHWQDDGVDDATPVPSLLLQPLLENAILHGIQRLPYGGDVYLLAEYENAVLQVTVTNPLPAVANGITEGGNGLARDNIRQRLQALFGERASFDCGAADGEYRARLRLPVDSPLEVAP